MEMVVFLGCKSAKNAIDKKNQNNRKIGKGE